MGACACVKAAPSAPAPSAPLSRLAALGLDPRPPPMGSAGQDGKPCPCSSLNMCCRTVGAASLPCAKEIDWSGGALAALLVRWRDGGDGAAAPSSEPSRSGGCEPPPPRCALHLPRRTGEQSVRDVPQKCASTGSFPEPGQGFPFSVPNPSRTGRGSRPRVSAPRRGCLDACARPRGTRNQNGSPRVPQGDHLKRNALPRLVPCLPWWRAHASRPLRLSRACAPLRGSLRSALTRARTPWVRLAKTGSPAPVHE